MARGATTGSSARDFVAVAVGMPDERRAQGEVPFAQEAELLVVDPRRVAVLGFDLHLGAADGEEGFQIVGLRAALVRGRRALDGAPADTAEAVGTLPRSVHHHR